MIAFLARELDYVYTDINERIMKVDKNLSRMLSQSAFIMNTIGGGMSMSGSSLRALEDHYMLRLRVPGIEPDSIHIEIDNKNLLIFQQMHFESLEIPHLIRRLVIPAEVNYRSITAEFHEGMITIRLPFNELADGYHQNIDLDVD